MTNLHADDAFLSYYELIHDPFTPRVPGFKFFPAQRKSVLGQLHHLARYGQLLLLIVGPKGSGKTLLRQALVASTNKQAVHTVILSGRECVGESGVLAQIARGIEAGTSSSNAILSRAGQLAMTGQEVYLLVDDAGLLEDQALQALLSLAAGNGEGRLHVFLFSGADIEERLRELSEEEKGFHCIELQPYEDLETREYLAQRLEGAGQSLDLLTHEQIHEIQERSGGWPGLINQIARETMVDAMLADSGNKPVGGFASRLPRKHILAFAVVLLAVCAVWMMRDDVPVSPAASSHSEAGRPAVQGRAADSVVEFAGTSSPQPQVAQPVIREPLSQAFAESESEDPAIASRGNARENDAAVEDHSTTIVPLPLPSAAEPDQGLQVVPVKPEPLVSKTSQDMQPAEPSGRDLSGPAPVPVSSAPEEPAVKPAALVNSKSEPSVASIPAGSDWYRSQLPTRVALQVLGTRSEANAKEFVKQYGSEYRYYLKNHQGSPMYVITYGVFSSRAAAEAAARILPAKVQAGKPWPKSFASIQQEMIRAR